MLRHVDRDAVMRWVRDYERSWRDGDWSAVDSLFTPDARYRTSPYETAMVGTEAIRAFWLDDDDGEIFTMQAEPVVVDGRDAVVRVVVRYGRPVHQEYRDLWVIRFADDGRADDFEEWAFWPGKPFAAADDG